MDFNKLTQLQLFALISDWTGLSYDELKTKAEEEYLSIDELLYSMVEDEFNKIPVEDRTIEKLPVILVDLHLANQIEPLLPQNQQSYLESKMLNLPVDQILIFANQFKIPYPENPNLSDLEFLRERVIRILKMVKLLNEDVLSESDPHVHIWTALIPQSYFPGIESDHYFDMADDGDQEFHQLKETYYPGEEVTEQEVLDQFETRLLRHLKSQYGNQVKKGDIIQRDDEYGPENRLMYLGENDNLFLTLGPDDLPNHPNFSYPEFIPGYYWNKKENEEWEYALFDGFNQYNVGLEWIQTDTIKDQLISNLRGPISTIDDKGLSHIENNDKVFRTHFTISGLKDINIEIEANDLSEVQNKLNVNPFPVTLAGLYFEYSQIFGYV